MLKCIYATYTMLYMQSILNSFYTLLHSHVVDIVRSEKLSVYQGSTSTFKYIKQLCVRKCYTYGIPGSCGMRRFSEKESKEVFTYFVSRIYIVNEILYLLVHLFLLIHYTCTYICTALMQCMFIVHAQQNIYKIVQTKFSAFIMFMGHMLHPDVFTFRLGQWAWLSQAVLLSTVCICWSTAVTISVPSKQ